MLIFGRNFWFSFLVVISGLGPVDSAAKVPGFSRKCQPGYHWVSPHARRAYQRADGIFVSASKVGGHCRKSSGAYQFWAKRIKNGRPNWKPFTNEEEAKWTVEERERLLEALDQLPDQLFISEVGNLYRLRKSSQHELNPASGSEGHTVLYDAAFTHKSGLARILAHELAHVYFKQMNENQKIEFAKAAGWKEGKLLRREVVAEDSFLSVNEDFSNSIEWYLFENRTPYSDSGKIYRWIKNHFGYNFKVKSGSAK